jgi:hypothetical protein
MSGISGAITQLIELIDRKRKLYDSIMEITIEQKKDIEENAAAGMEALINRKQTVINEIDEIDRVFSGLLGLLKKQLDVNSLEEADLAKYPTLKALKLKVGEIMSLGQNIMEVEVSNKEKLVAIMNAMKKEMKQMSVGRKSIKAYETPVINNDGIYIDKKK